MCLLMLSPTTVKTNYLKCLQLNFLNFYPRLLALKLVTENTLFLEQLKLQYLCPFFLAFITVSQVSHFFSLLKSSFLLFALIFICEHSSLQNKVPDLLLLSISLLQILQSLMQIVGSVVCFPTCFSCSFCTIHHT